MNLKLVKPSEKYLKSVCKAAEEYLLLPSQFMISAVNQMIKAKDEGFEAYFKKIENEQAGIGLKPGHVAQTTYWLAEDDEYIGTFVLRHDLTPALEKIGGHIAYAVYPSKRQKGYGYQGLKLCLEKAYDMGMEKVLITCNAKNVASYKLIHKVMLEYGGTELDDVEIENGFEKRIWVHTNKRYGKIRPLAVALIKRNNQVLAVAGYDEIKKEKFYRLPGGGIEFGETSIEALKREIKEEIGADIFIGRKFGVFENIFTFNGQKGHEIIIAYEASLSEENMKKDKIAMLEKEFEGAYYEFVEITKDTIIYPKILEKI